MKATFGLVIAGVIALATPNLAFAQRGGGGHGGGRSGGGGFHGGGRAGGGGSRSFSAPRSSGFRSAPSRSFSSPRSSRSFSAPRSFGTARSFNRGHFGTSRFYRGYGYGGFRYCYPYRHHYGFGYYGNYYYPYYSYPYYPYYYEPYYYDPYYYGTTVYTPSTVVEPAPTTDSYYDSAPSDPSQYEQQPMSEAYPPAQQTPNEQANPQVQAPGNAPAYDARTYIRDGDWAFVRGDYPRAADAYQRALSLHGERARAQLSLGLALIGMRQYDDAADAIRQALIMQPRLANSSFDLRRTFGKQEDLGARVKEMQDKVAKAPNDADAMLLLGFTQLFSGDAASGRATLDKYAQMSPNDHDLQPFMDEMNRAVSGGAAGAQPATPVQPAPVAPLNTVRPVSPEPAPSTAP